jgi:uncharacterized protein YxjI
MSQQQQMPASNLVQMDRMFVRQKAKLIELNNEYGILDENGNQVGAVIQEGQSKLKKAARFLSNVDQFMTHQLGVWDAQGMRVLTLVRPGKIMKSKVQVSDGSGRPVGTIVQQNVFGKVRFSLEGNGVALGEIRAENWRAWNFSIVDHTGAERARITKKWEGLGRAMFTTADHYMVEMDPSITGDFRLLVLAAALGIDTALKQDSN